MIEASESVTIDAPVERVFAFVDDPDNHLTVTPSLADVRNVERLGNGGKRLDYTFRMAGISRTLADPGEREDGPGGRHCVTSRGGQPRPVFN